jgi:hypothetical protein
MARSVPIHRSRLWYLFPVFLGVIGGLIAYFILWVSNSAMASNTLWIGIILSAVVAAIAIAIYWMYYIDITSARERISTSSVVDTAYGQELVIVPTFAFMVLFYPLQLIVVVYQSRDSLRIGYILLTQVYQLFPSLIWSINLFTSWSINVFLKLCFKLTRLVMADISRYICFIMSSLLLTCFHL